MFNCDYGRIKTCCNVLHEFKMGWQLQCRNWVHITGVYLCKYIRYVDFKVTSLLLITNLLKICSTATMDVLTLTAIYYLNSKWAGHVNGPWTSPSHSCNPEFVPSSIEIIILGRRQCDQMVKFLCSIGPLATIKICPILKKLPN